MSRKVVFIYICDCCGEERHQDKDVLPMDWKPITDKDIHLCSRCTLNDYMKKQQELWDVRIGMSLSQ